MKILVTGANGYLGTGIVKELLDRGEDVTATDFSVERVDKRAERMAGNLFQIEHPYFYFGKPDAVLHLAWRDGFVHYSDAHLEDLSLHCKLIQRLAEEGTRRIAVMGSMHEIVFFEGSIDETTPCHPQSMYGIAKNALREASQIIAQKSGTQLQWLRGYYIVGNQSYGSSIFSKIAKAAEDGKTEFPFTMGQNQFDFLDYGEFCCEVAEAVRQDKINGIINICSGRPEKLAERVERFIRENGYRITLQYGKFPDRPYDSKAVWGNDRKIRKILELAGAEK